jgi:hypothetical protein
MTTKERLHQLIDQLPESETDRAFRFLEELATVSRTPNLPTAAEMGGRFPDLTGDMTTAEYLKLVRGG